MTEKVAKMEEAKRAAKGPSRAQSRRARQALDLLEEHAWLIPESGWVQLNARSGDALHMASVRHLLRPGGSWGADPSADFVRAARVRHPNLAEWIEASATDIPLEDGQAGLAMLLEKGDEPLEDILREMRRLVRGNSVALLALPAPGEDCALEVALKKVTQENPAWQEKEIERDPLLRLGLAETIRLAESQGFLPFWGATFYEPTGYSSPALRLTEIEQEGRDLWLQFFKEEKQEEAWMEIKDAWLESLPPGNGAHRHRAFSSYILLRAL